MNSNPDIETSYDAAGAAADGNVNPSTFTKCDEAVGMMSDVRETELVRLLGIARPELVRLRRANLRENLDWYYTKPPRTVMITPNGRQAISRLLDLGEAIPAEAGVPQQTVRPSGWLADEDIPKNQSNGLILAKGRPGWWTDEEAIVRQTAFVNRKAIFVEWRGKRTICRVKNASAFVVGQVIPVRRYDNILLAARQPRWPGKW